MSDKTKHRLVWQRWCALVLCLAAIWLFGAVIGPALQHRIPLMDQIVQVADESNIDMGAYFYTEIEASYEGEQYLRDTLQFSKPNGADGFSWPFISAVVICMVLLALGFRYLPND